MDKIRITIHIDKDASEILDQSVTTRKRGEYISELIRQGKPDGGILERIEERLRKIETKLSQP